MQEGPFGYLQANHERIVGVCAVLLFVLVVAAIVSSQMWLLTVAAIPLALGVLTAIVARADL